MELNEERLNDGRVMRSTLIVVAALAALASEPSPARAALKETCATNNVAVITATGKLTTNSRDYVDVTDSGLRFIQGGNRPGCVVVTFSAEAAAPQDDVLMIHALLDGESCTPGTIYFARGEGSPSAITARTMSFLCNEVTPGAHRIKLRYRSTEGGTVALEYRTLTVHYFK